MSQLAFFPWFPLLREIAVDEFRLIPYSRGKAPESGKAQEAIDQVLEAYKDMSGEPIWDCAILTHQARGLVDDIPDEFQEKLFTFGELVALAGLAKRRFFAHIEYNNRDTFSLMIHTFKAGERGVAVTNRRRDGPSRIQYADNSYAVRCPDHIFPSATTLEPAFLTALVRAMETTVWPRLYQGVVSFNEANTDRPGMSLAAEMMLSYAAIEQILDLVGKPPKAVAARFEEVVASRICPKDKWKVTSSNANVINRVLAAPSLRYAWIEDFATARGSVAHGNHPTQYPSAWSVHDHLLLASFAIPRLIKCVLASRDWYELTEDDRIDIDALEFLINEKHFGGPNVTALDTHPWGKVLGDQRIHRWVQRGTEDLDNGEACSE